MEVFTIGFTRKNAETFFEKLKEARIQRLLDVRLHPASQLSAFAKSEDLAYFLRELCQIEYRHAPPLAPTQELLDSYRRQKTGWENYRTGFLELMLQRKVEHYYPHQFFEPRTVLLCSENSHQQCHRSLVLEYLLQQGYPLQVSHL